MAFAALWAAKLTGRRIAVLSWLAIFRITNYASGLFA
jgi:hypothetical protein